MKYSWLPSWNTFLLYIGGIPTLITATCVSIMIFFTARNKAFSYKELKGLKNDGLLLIKKENNLRDKVLAAPKGVQFIYRIIIGDLNYFRLVNGR